MENRDCSKGSPIEKNTTAPQLGHTKNDVTITKLVNVSDVDLPTTKTASLAGASVGERQMTVISAGCQSARRSGVVVCSHRRARRGLAPGLRADTCGVGTRRHAARPGPVQSPTRGGGRGAGSGELRVFTAVTEDTLTAPSSHNVNLRSR